MEIKAHLSDEQFASLLAGEEKSSQHFDDCKECRAEFSLLQKNLSAMPRAVRSATDLPPYFWQRQRAAIQSRIAVEEASRRSWAGLAWATAASLVLIAILLVNGAKKVPATQVQADPDQELLLAVEHAVQSDVPESLAPAALLAEDIRTAVEGSSATLQDHKEKSNEN